MGKSKIGIFVGSLRRESFCRSIARAAVALAPENLELSFIRLEDISLYNQDMDDDGTPPDSWVRFRREAAVLDGLLFVTPEYNRSLAPLLKNALDVGSRPYESSVWGGKPGAIISVSPSAMGAFGANQQIRQPMAFLNILMMQQPEAYIGNVTSRLDEQGELVDQSTRDFLNRYMEAFAGWVKRVNNDGKDDLPR